MSAWTASTLAVFTTVEEVRIVTQRQDNIRFGLNKDLGFSPEDREASGTAYDVTFTEAQEGDLDAVDAAYQGKYGRRYASIVRDLCRPVPRAATLQVHLA